MAEWRNYRDFTPGRGPDVAGLRWVEDGSYTDLRDGAGRVLGSVRRSARPGRGWWAWCCAGRRDWSAFFPDRAAAMRAVAGRCDPRKGYLTP